METNKIYCGDNLTVLKTFPDKSIQMCVTSPAYYGLRDYQTAKWVGGDVGCDHIAKNGHIPGPNAVAGNTVNEVCHTVYKNTCGKCGALRVDGQIGLEETPELYVEKLVEVFREVKRILKDDGTLWLNLGDSYNGSGGPGNQRDNKVTKGEFKKYDNPNRDIHGLKHKDLIGIPWMVAFALRADGWYLRSDIIWNKPNPMPESVTDRPTKSHEYMFLLTKSAQYYYDSNAVAEPAMNSGGNGNFSGRQGGARNTVISGGNGTKNRGQYKNLQDDGQKPNSIHERRALGFKDEDFVTRNKRSVWTVNLKPYKEAHFATYPPELIEPCILAGTSEKGECPKCGKAWTRVTVRQNESNWEFRKEKGAVGGSMEFGDKQQIGSGWSHDLPSRDNKTVGWQPGCTCFGHFEDVPFVESEPEKTWSKFLADTEVEEPIPQTVLDPFFGSGTTGFVAQEKGRSWIGIDLSEKYCKLAKKRTDAARIPLF